LDSLAERKTRSGPAAHSGQRNGMPPSSVSRNRAVPG
jgi:hypothetical protein